MSLCSKRPPRSERFRRRRRRLLASDPHCYYCRKGLVFETSTLDHKKPKSKGGKDSKENLVLACHECNQKKGSKSVEKFMKKVKKVNREMSLLPTGS